MRSTGLEPNSGSFGGVSKGIVSVQDAAAITLSKDNSGKIHVMPDLTADCIVVFLLLGIIIFFVTIKGL